VWLVWAFALLAPPGALLVLAWGSELMTGLPDVDRLAERRPPLPTRVYDREGRLLTEFSVERRQLADIDDLPEPVVLAFVAAEDGRFFEHPGVDPLAMARAAWVNLRSGAVRQGASTITQQTVKNLLLTSERSMGRKLREALLAIELERRFGKRKILEIYLNEIYFGSGAYGVEEAAYEYFGKRAAELSVSEAALIASLAPRPSAYSPRRDPDAAERGRLRVLGRMHDQGFLDDVEWARARADRPRIRPLPARDPRRDAAAWFVAEVRDLLEQQFGAAWLRTAGLRVETTLDLDLQEAAQASLQRGLETVDLRQGFWGALGHVPPAARAAYVVRLGRRNRLLGTSAAASIALPDRPLEGLVRERDADGTARVAVAPGLEVRLELPGHLELAPGDRVRVRPLLEADGAGATDLPRAVLAQEPRVEGALVSIDPATGEIAALVGGYRFGRSYFDRATQARRMPGSAFKPFVYGAAIEHGYTAASIVIDRPFVAEGWSPQNYGRHFLGSLTLREAMARSVNNATVHLAQRVGVDEIADFAHRLGIHSRLGADLTIALGTSPVSLLELTGSYATLAAGGRREAPYLIRRVLDRNGRILLERPPALPEDPSRLGADQPTETPQVVAPEVADVVTDLLRGAVIDPGATGWRAASIPHFVAGKTGTTSNEADAWFVGFTPRIATGVWVGYDRGRLMARGETGAHTALPIWRQYMEAAIALRGAGERERPEGVVVRWIDAETGLLADASSRRSFRQSFVRGTEPRISTSRWHAAASAAPSVQLVRQEAPAAR
jgi:penicillin-binding protein 1A